MLKNYILKPTFPAIVIGLILGVVFSYLHYKLIEFTLGDAIDSKSEKYDLLLVILTIAKPIVLALPLAFAILLPQLISIIAVLVGVLLHKGLVMLMAVRKKD